ncbi:MAG: DNA double-strand break repair nuclease NurA [Thermofilaceae archaeon]
MSIFRTIEEVITRVEEDLKGLAEPINTEHLNKTGFVDGSFALDERRGVYMLSLSAASLIVSGDRLEKLLPGSSRPLITVLAPKSYGESRAGLLMSMLEMFAAIDIIKRGVDAIFLDGSYISEMMVPFGHPHDVQENLTLAKLGYLYPDIEDKYGEKTLALVCDKLGEEPLNGFSKLLEGISGLANSLYQEISLIAPDIMSKKEALDYSVVYVEATAYLSTLNEFLKRCMELNTAPLWVAKDAESRFIVEKKGILGWLNDLSLLDHSWRTYDSVYALIEGARFGRPKSCAASRKLLEEVYSKWSTYHVLYFKLRRKGPVSQMTFPSFVSLDTAVKAVSTLSELSDQKGYPRPLSYVHHLAVLNPELVRLMADELYKREHISVVRSMLAPSGRAMAGLR